MATTLRKYLFFVITILLFSQLPAFSQEIPLTFQPVKDKPFIVSQDITVDTAEYNTLFFRLKAKENGTGRLYWALSIDPKFDQIKSLLFYIKSGEHNYTFNLPSQNPNWVDWARKFLIYPENSGQKIEVLSARITRSDLISNISSGWQEFWGPNRRVVVGSTINLISSSSIYGISINIYLYCIIAIGFIILFAKYLLERPGDNKHFNKKLKNKDLYKPLWSAYNKAIRGTLFIMLACWIFLALNAGYNFLGIFTVDLPKYFGKDIEQKRSAAYSKELYDFLVFAKKELPKEPIEFQILSATPNLDLQARIYLIPHICSYTTKEPDYLLMLKPGPEQLAKTKGFTIVAKLNDNAYIMKRAK